MRGKLFSLKAFLEGLKLDGKGDTDGKPDLRAEFFRDGHSYRSVESIKIQHLSKALLNRSTAGAENPLCATMLCVSN